MKKLMIFLFIIIGINTVFAASKVVVNVATLSGFRDALSASDQIITLAVGEYELEDLASDNRVLTISGSNNVINLTGAKINARVGCIRETWFVITGNNNIVRGGTIEDYYSNGLTKVTDFSAYNHDHDNLAYGLKGAAVVTIQGNHNRVVGLTLTPRGSFPFGYGSQYGIGSTNTFGVNKRCGILITGNLSGGIGNELDSITLYQRAFGHGIYMQSGADSTTIKNSYVEGRMRLSDDMYNDTNSYDLPYITHYKFPTGDSTWRLVEGDTLLESYPIPHGVMYPLSEDGIRMYSNTGSITVENCTVKQMRGGIRLYLGGKAIVKNSTAIDCGFTNFNFPADAEVSNCTGNFSYNVLSDFRLARNRQNLDIKILPSPHALGPHNIADILGGGHTITFRREAGPLDTAETRAIYVYGNNSTIINETEYTIILKEGTSGNDITSCGPVIDSGSNNVTLNDCPFDLGCGEPQEYETVDVFPKQIGTFNYSFQIETTGSVNNGVIGLSTDTAANGFNDLAAIVQFNEDGTIKARNATTYEADNVFYWDSQKSYDISMSVDVVNKTYSVSVAETGKDSVVIATDYAFRTDWTGSTYLDRAIVKTTACPLLFSNSVMTKIEDTTTAIIVNGLITNEQLKVYPNPINSNFVIELDTDKKASYKVYDINGKVVLSGKTTGQKTTIDESRLASGIYLVKVGDKTKVVYKTKE